MVINYIGPHWCNSNVLVCRYREFINLVILYLDRHVWYLIYVLSSIRAVVEVSFLNVPMVQRIRRIVHLVRLIPLICVRLRVHVHRASFDRRVFLRGKLRPQRGLILNFKLRWFDVYWSPILDEWLVQMILIVLRTKVSRLTSGKGISIRNFMQRRICGVLLAVSTIDNNYAFAVSKYSMKWIFAKMRHMLAHFFRDLNLRRVTNLILMVIFLVVDELIASSLKICWILKCHR